VRRPAQRSGIARMLEVVKKLGMKHRNLE
jgi:hypothetical protein